MMPARCAANRSREEMRRPVQPRHSAWCRDALPLIFPSLQFDAFYAGSRRRAAPRRVAKLVSAIASRVNRAVLASAPGGTLAHVRNWPAESRLCQVRL